MSGLVVLPCSFTAYHYHTTFVGNVVFLILVSIICAGCFTSKRVCVTTDVSELDNGVRTVNKYEIVRKNLAYSKNINSADTAVLSMNATAKRMFPGVFADGGIPITISEDIEYKSGPNVILGPIPLILPIPDRQSQTFVRKEALALAAAPEVKMAFNVLTKHDFSTSFWLPTALLCFSGSGGEQGKPCFDAHARAFCNPNARVAPAEERESAEQSIEIGAIASRLKEMEVSGLITADVIAKSVVYRRRLDEKRREEAEKARQRVATLKPKEPKARIPQTHREPVIATETSTPPYRVEYLKRDEGSDFAYRFALVLNGEASTQTFFVIHKMFADEVRSAYCREYPNADSDSLWVSVSHHMENGRIEGRAEVLTIIPVSLSYNADSRRGKLAVRFKTGQAEEAREWARKNIETLARDKNIALVTGQLPPEATYYSLGEKIEGNVIEIEFKTE